MGLQVTDVSLGEVSFSLTGDNHDIELIDEKLKPLGFSVLMDKRVKLVKSIKVQTPVKLTTVGRFKLTTPGRSKLTMLGRAKLTT